VKRMARLHEVLLVLGNHEAYDAIAPVDLFSDRVSTAWRAPLLTAVPDGPVILSIPYARRGRPPFDGLEHDGTIQGSMAAIAAEIARLVDQVVSHYHDRPTIVLGHFTIEGMAVQGTEFEVHQATEVVVPRSAFAHVGLTAVGHIHRAQDVALGIIGVGSLIRHSFAEKHDAKSYTLVSVDGGEVSWERRPVPCRDMYEYDAEWGAKGWVKELTRA